MGFTKDKFEPEVTIEVRHPFYPETLFGFTFPKILPEAALDAEKTLQGLTDNEREALSRISLIRAVAYMLTKDPTGFDDFPMSANLPSGKPERSIAERSIEYFDDPGKPELEQILSAAWLAYKRGAAPSAYLKSAPDHV